MSNSDIYDGPSIDWDVYEPELCDCGHFHIEGAECPDPGAPCGDYRCCINY